MGFPFKKKKKQQQPQEAAAAAASSPDDSFVSGDSSTGLLSNKKKKTKRSARRGGSSGRTASTADSTPPSLLNTLNVMAPDNANFEVMTPESCRNLAARRADKRRDLFGEDDTTTSQQTTPLQRHTTEPPSLNTSMQSGSLRSTSFADTRSQEVTPGGQVVSASGSSSDDDSDDEDDASAVNTKIHELTHKLDSLANEELKEDRREAVQRRQSQPISVDVSYTSSELASLSGSPPPHTTKEDDSPPTTTTTAAAAAETPTNKLSTPARSVLRKSDPVSVDVSFTESELASVSTTPPRSSPKQANKATPEKVPSPKAISPNIPHDERAAMEDQQRQKQEEEEKKGDDDSVNQGGIFFSLKHKTKVETTKDVDPSLFDASTIGDNSKSLNDESFKTKEDPPSMGTANSRMPACRPFLYAFSCGELLEHPANAMGNAFDTTCVLDKVQRWRTVVSRSNRDSTYDAADSTTVTSFTAETAAKARPAAYDDATTQRFLRRLMHHGFVLLSLQPPGSPTNSTAEWNGRTVTMTLEKGGAVPPSVPHPRRSRTSREAPEPRLQWSTVAGGQSFDVSTTSVDLLSILSITTGDDEDVVDDQDNTASTETCFFTITTDAGAIYIFEAASPEERDRIVTGLKSIVARLCLHVITGNVTASAELFAAAADEDLNRSSSLDDMPLLPNPVSTMNRVAHHLLEV